MSILCTQYVSLLIDTLGHLLDTCRCTIFVYLVNWASQIGSSQLNISVWKPDNISKWCCRLIEWERERGWGKLMVSCSQTPTLQPTFSVTLNEKQCRAWYIHAQTQAQVHTRGVILPFLSDDYPADFRISQLRFAEICMDVTWGSVSGWSWRWTLLIPEERLRGSILHEIW